LTPLTTTDALGRMSPGRFCVVRARSAEQGNRSRAIRPTERNIVNSIPTAASELTSPGSVVVDDPAAIETLRGQIDAVDTAIARLVAERVQLSHRVQTARMNAGGTRVELGRERTILAGYRAALGADGPALAEAVLRVCRGRV
jgi:chorismate mutase